MVFSNFGCPEKNGTNRKVITMSDTKTITVRKDLVYNVSLIKNQLAEQACCRAEDVPFEDGEGDPTACFLGLRKVMHDNLFDIKSVTPDGLNIAEHSGCYMAIKYGRPDQSGWHIALMTQTPTQDVMELFFCFSDMTRPNWLCDVRHMVKLPFRHFESQRMFSWLLLQSSKPDKSARPN